MIAVYFADVERAKPELWVQKAYEYMPKERLQKIGSMKNDTAKKLSLAAGLLLYFGLRQRGLDCRILTFEKGEHEKPYIAGGGMPFFNISHSGAKAVCALADTEVGVDIEQVRDKEPNESLIRKVCTDTEREYLQGIASKALMREQFYKLWTVKECVMKQCGMGLALDPGMIEAVAAFEQDHFMCREMAVRIRRQQDYYISVCGSPEEPAMFRQINLEELIG